MTMFSEEEAGIKIQCFLQERQEKENKSFLQQRLE
jgi:hypothetical protein